MTVQPATPSKTPPSVGFRTSLLRDPFQYLMTASAEHDGLVRLGAGPLTTYVVSHPDYVRQILVTNSANYIKGSLMEPFRNALGNGLVTSEGDFWKQQRRVMQPAFHATQLQLMEEHITQCIARAETRWDAAAEAGQPVNFLDSCIELNVEIILGVLFSTSIDAAKAERLQQLTSQVFVGLASKVWTFFLPDWFPLPGAVRYRRAVAALDAEVYALIEQRRAMDDPPADLLSLMLEMNDQQLRDEIFTLFMAGYETTATGLTWAAYELSRHPDIADKMVAELDGTRPTFADLPNLPYGKKVIDETFRLHPPFPIWFRMTVDADQLGPYHLGKDAKIVLNPHITHRDPRFWENPETFDPDRTINRHAYYPFGKGSRVCIGERLSTTITQLVLSTLVRRFRFAVPDDFQVIPRYVVTCQPKGGLPLLLTHRES